MNAIELAVNQRCNGCGFSKNFITSQRFQCNNLEVNQVTFRARMYGSCTYSNASIVSDMGAWVSMAPTIILQGSQYAIDPNCVPVNIISFGISSSFERISCGHNETPTNYAAFLSITLRIMLSTNITYYAGSSARIISASYKQASTAPTLCCSALSLIVCLHLIRICLFECTICAFSYL